MIKYSLLRILRDRVTIFWALCFQFILATLFEVSFGHMNDSLDQIQTAVVVKRDGQAAQTFQKFLKEVQKEDNDLLAVSTMDQKEADRKLKSEKIAGYYLLGEDVSLTVAGNGVPESVLQSLMESYDSQAAYLKTILKEKPQQLAAVTQKIGKNVLKSATVKEVTLSGKKVDGMIQYFFSAVAMACMFGCFLGMEAAIRLQANVKAVAARRCVSSTSKMKMALADIAMVILVDYVFVVLFLVYLVFGLKKDFGNNPAPILLITFAGCLIGASMGLLVGSIGKWGEDVKVAIILSVSLGTTFLSGLMVSGIKGLIEKNCPILNRINPSALITDALYSVAVYPDVARYRQDVAIMLLMGALCIAIVFFLTRRVRYDSI